MKKAQNPTKEKKCFVYPIPDLLRSALALLRLLAFATLPLQDGLSISVEFQLADDDLRGVDSDWDRLEIGLLIGNTLDVNDIFETIHRCDLALLALVTSADNGYLIVLADGYASNLYKILRSILEYFGVWEPGFKEYERHTSPSAPWREGPT